MFLTLPSAALQKKFQVLVDRALYGGYYDFSTVASGVSSRLAQANDRECLIEILTGEFPLQMQIARSAILLDAADDCLQLQGSGGQPFAVPVNGDGVCRLLAECQRPVRSLDIWAGVDRKTAEIWRPMDWVQLFVPIYHDRLLGILLLGERTGGVLYSNQDLQIIQAVSQQAALSLANIQLVEALRGLARQLVRSDEEQRRQVARDLHDDVLQNLFFLNGKIAAAAPELVGYLDQTITRLRQTIRSQRPSLLAGGIVLALQGLVAEMNELAGDYI